MRGSSDCTPAQAPHMQFSEVGIRIWSSLQADQLGQHRSVVHKCGPGCSLTSAQRGGTLFLTSVASFCAHEMSMTCKDMAAMAFIRIATPGQTALHIMQDNSHVHTPVNLILFGGQLASVWCVQRHGSSHLVVRAMQDQHRRLNLRHVQVVRVHVSPAERWQAVDGCTCCTAP